MSRYDRDYRLPKRVTLNVAAIYLPTYRKSDDGGNFKAAEKLLEHHNIGMQLWPAGGAKQSINSFTLYDKPYDKKIPDNGSAYRKLRKDVNARMSQNKATGYPFLVPIIFCDFVAGGKAITPHGTKVGAASPACLIRISGAATTDQMTVLHEMGHAVLYPDPDHDNYERGNLMHEAEPRSFMYRYQVEAFGKAFFAHH